MTSLRRWMEDPARNVERRLLQTSLADEPREGEIDQMWKGMEQRLGCPPSLPRATTGKRLWQVGAAALCMTGLAAAALQTSFRLGDRGATSVATNSAAQVSIERSASQVGPEPLPTPEGPSRVPLPEVPEPAAPLPSRVQPQESTAAKASRASRVPLAANAAAPSSTGEESRQVALVRDALHRGNAQAALVGLRQLSVDAPSGVLREDRDALEIRALAALGHTADARELARRFLQRYPVSPLLRQVAPLAR